MKYALVFSLFTFSTSSLATPSARSPDYCTHLICLETSRLFGDSKVASSSASPGSKEDEIKIISEKGEVSILIKKWRRSLCDQPKEIVLNRRDGNYFYGEGELPTPDGNSCLRLEVNLKIVDGVDSKIVMPISALWIVDEAPMTFWEKGYSLRLGPAVEIKVSADAKP